MQPYDKNNGATLYILLSESPYTDYRKELFANT